MDDIVKQAMVKWPDVPAVYGWLSLDRRGRWLIKGERISSPAINAFINRNYGRDAAGCWYFQNGPQRVFVALAYTPLIFRLVALHGSDTDLQLATHTGATITRVEGAWIDELGMLLLASDRGPGIVDDSDLERILPCLTDERGGALTEDAIAAAIAGLQSGCAGAGMYFCYRGAVVPLSPIKAADAPVRLGFVQNPAPPPGHEPC